MSKAKNVSVGIVNLNGEEIQVWCAKFTVRGNIPMKDGKVDEVARRAIEKRIAAILESTDFQE